MKAAGFWHTTGIDSATAGDDVLVAPGQYYEYDIAMEGGIWVHSTEGPGLTTVSARALGAGFICTDLEESPTIEGFTIQDGAARGDDQYEGSGGGMRCIRSALVVRSCVMSNCTSERGAGGGICAWDSNITVASSTVAECYAGYVGGGIFSYGSVTVISDCVITNNQSSGTAGVLANGPEVTIARCVVSWNTTGLPLGIGGMSCTSPVLRIEDCLVAHNFGPSYPYASALAVWYSTGSISGCTIASNGSWPRDAPWTCSPTLVHSL